MDIIERLIKLNISEACFDSILEKCFKSMTINEGLTLSKEQRGYINSLKYKNPYCLYKEQEPYPNAWSKTGFVLIDGEKWKFYAREKCARCMGFDPKWSLINVNNEIIDLKSSELDSLLGENGEKLNESSDEKVGALFAGRQKKYEEEPSLENKYKLKRTMIAIGNREGRKAKADLDNLKKEVEAERSGEAERKRKVQALKDVYKYGDSKKAGEEHDNALINQYNRNKLEKSIEK